MLGLEQLLLVLAMVLVKFLKVGVVSSKAPGKALAGYLRGLVKGLDQYLDLVVMMNQVSAC